MPKAFSVWKTFIAFLVTMFVAEFGIMHLLKFFGLGSGNVWLELLIDAALLTTVMTIVLVALVYRSSSRAVVNLATLIELSIVRTGLSVFCIEALIMMLTDMLMIDASISLEAFVDAAFVTFAMAPFLYFWVLVPVKEMMKVKTEFSANNIVQNRSEWRTAALSVLFGLAIIAAATLSTYSNEHTRAWSEIESQSQSDLDRVALLLRRELVSVVTDLQLASKSQQFLKFLNTRDSDGNLLARDWEQLVTLKSMLLQVRYLDREGMEKMRVDSAMAKGRMVDSQSLQSKANRYYFQDALAMQQGGVYVSPLDLNVERGKIEVPHKPVTRIGMPIYLDNSDLRGVLLMNIDMRNILNKVKEISDRNYGAFMFLNHAGYYIIAKDKKLQWGFMFPNQTGTTFQDKYPAAWKDIGRLNNGVTDNEDGKFIYSTVKVTAEILNTIGAQYITGVEAPMWHIVWHMPKNYEPASLVKLRKELTVLLLIIVPLFIVVVTSLTKSRVSRNSMLSDLHKAREKAETSERSKSEFLASMSHEIRTPMTAVMGFADMLMEDRLADESREKVHRIKDATRSLMTIINDILDMSKMEAGKLEIEDIDFNIQSLLKDVLALFDAKGKANGTKSSSLSLHFSDDFPIGVQSDPTRIRQVLVNLIGNAMKFTKDGVVRVECSIQTLEAGEALLRIVIQDTGIGMTAKTQSKLFTDFTQADASITRNFEGTGLGLAICKRLVNIMHGDIGVHSELGVGSTFWFTLPLVKAQTDVSNQHHTSLSKTVRYEATRSLRILVAEDNDLNQRIICSMIENVGHVTKVAVNGAKAVEAYEQGEFDLILMDVRMPELSGPDATKMIRRMPGAKSNVPIIALTADAMMEHRKSYSEAGMNVTVTKPIERDVLLEAINAVMDEEIHVRHEDIEVPVLKKEAATAPKPQEPDADIEDFLMSMDEA